MAKGLIGKKIGCTQLWKDDEYVMVTAITTVPNIVVYQKIMSLAILPFYLVKMAMFVLIRRRSHNGRHYAR